MNAARDHGDGMKLAIALVTVAGCAATTPSSPAPLGGAETLDVTGMVRTPFGYFDPSCVYALDAAGNRPDGVAACATDHPALGPDTVIDETDGWKASEWYQAAPMSLVSASWVVPPAPTGQVGQTLYYFPGLEPASYDDIVQPVLAWDGFSDNAWTMTSWNCCETGNVWHSNPISVSPGDTVYGYAKGSACDATTGVCAAWTILSGDDSTGQTTTLAATGSAAFTAAQGGVLETYGVAACDDLTTAVKFEKVEVAGIAGKLEKPTGWVPDIASATPSCSYAGKASIGTDTSTVTISDRP
jgi:hypothetical protein